MNKDQSLTAFSSWLIEFCFGLWGGRKSYTWQEPHVTFNESDHIVVEWWSNNGNKRLMFLFDDPYKVWYLRSCGDEQADGTRKLSDDCLDLYSWLYE